MPGTSPSRREEFAVDAKTKPIFASATAKKTVIENKTDEKVCRKPFQC